MEQIIKKLLSEKRSVHSMGVAETAKKLAIRLGTDPQKAYLAGLVHDIAKELPEKEQFDLCKEGNIELNEVEKRNTGLLHGPAGSVLIKKYGINDPEIEAAVKSHTFGRAGMSLLEKIIYLADMIEPSRIYDGVDNLRLLCEEDFNKAFAEALKQSIVWNLEKSRLIHVGTLDAWNVILIRRNEN